MAHENLLGGNGNPDMDKLPKAWLQVLRWLRVALCQTFPWRPEGATGFPLPAKGTLLSVEVNLKVLDMTPMRSSSPEK